MSIFETKYITRAEAEEMVRAVRKRIEPRDEVSNLTLEQLDEELDEYVHKNVDCECFTDIVGYAYNYIIEDK